jgi:hypothetical protein
MCFPVKVHSLKITLAASNWWLMSVIPATQEAEIRRVVVQNQPGINSLRPYLKKIPSQKRAGRVAQGVGP